MTTGTISRAPTGARAVSDPLGRAVRLTWVNPPVTAFGGAFLVGTRVVRRERSHPTGPDDGIAVLTGDTVTESYVDEGLTPGTRYYYTVFAFDGTGYHAADGSSAAALATADHGLAERLYAMLPAVHQRDDLALRADEIAALAPQIQETLRSLPPELRGRGQLRRFLTAVAAPLALARSTAEALRDLHDIDRVPPEYLPLLAAFIDWRTDRTLPVYAQRNEVRAAPALYRTVGTVPNLRGIVTRYTGWQIRVAEYAQHLARSNQPAQANVFALRETAAGWRAATDAADLLGFAPPNTGDGLASVTGTLAGPFPLAPGQEFTVATDAGGPVTARFAATDAVALGAATAVEVAAVVNRVHPDVTATALPNGRLRLDAHEGTLRVEPAETSLVSLDGAPRGRLSPVAVTGGFHLFHAVSDPLAPVRDRAARRAAAGTGFARAIVTGEALVPAPAVTAPPFLPPSPQGTVCVKSYRGGQWGGSAVAFPGGEPAAAALPPAGPGLPGRVLLAWVDRPGFGDARVMSAIGTPGTATPPALTGVRSGPFPIPHGSWLVLADATGRRRGVQFARDDFADPAAPMLGEVIAVINLRAGGITTASAAPGGALRLTGASIGTDASLTVDLARSGAATALGFGPNNATASGDWGDVFTWTPAQPVPVLSAGNYADLAAVADGTGVQLAYATRDALTWRVRTLRFDGAAWGGDELLSQAYPDGQPEADKRYLSSREPSLGRDPDGRLWAVWARQGAHTGGDWRLRARSKPSGGAWSAEAAVTTTGGVAGDREPGVLTRPGLPPLVYFRTDRTGGADLWSVAVGGAATEVTAGGPADTWPAPVTAGGATWLLHRSDRSTPHAAAGRVAVPDTGTITRYAGTTSVVLGDIDRLRRLGTWDDLVAYTSHRPAGDLDDPLRDDELYTRGTVGLYLTQAVSGLLDESMAERLRAVLRRFLPVNTRAVVRLAPRAEVEYVYTAAADLLDPVEDKHPDIEHQATAETVAVNLPGWGILGSAVPSTPPPADPTATGVSADPAHPLSMRWRTHHQPPQ
ncbi:hypothetical protein Afil01_34250 [Actinorhabdospora filicis]|uniref:Fibronectin type-III domain-containing protein n=1 Tax=Actinorhabdospora filicis TaxID=1785913 RepID=A0A9W6SLU6_9ACTN|nr:phage tail protein [Actinorhabdospora filicis]GLZ78618.1 hypothetical protein Afil01_34250 [Actinorhabdospora filicis]